MCKEQLCLSLPQHSRKRISLPCYLFFPCWTHCPSWTQGFPRVSIPPGRRCGTKPSLQKSPFTQKPPQFIAVPAVHRRCCPWRSVPGPACPWGISGGPGGRRAARGSRGPAAAPPAAPAAACRGCSLRRAGASSSPSDPSGSRAARQQETREARQDTVLCSFEHHSSPKPRRERRRGEAAWLVPKLHLELQQHSCCPSKATTPPRTSPG